MSGTGHDATAPAGELRARLAQLPEIPRHADAAEEPRETDTVSGPEAQGKHGKRNGAAAEQKTYGRTPGGTIFTVPETHDMVSQLFSPSEPKNMSDFVLIAFLAFHVSMLLWVPRSILVPCTGLVYLFWRAAYNAGIGWLLWQQSNRKFLTTWARKSKIFEHPSKGGNKRPWLYELLKHELEAKIQKDYKFDEAPLEYNTWLLFRRLVDVILLCDFVSYCVFAIACGGRPDGEGALLTAARWAGGIILFLFNLWVKLDAHRVVKDFAWYWGDFFFLIDQDLQFDGVFEMAPHPMYSVGYAGYYGISMMAASYKVLFISILGHAAQMVFLTYVENPHIEKTYSALPPPRRRTSEHASTAQGLETATHTDPISADPEVVDNAPKGLLAIDPHRFENVATFLVLLYLAVLTMSTPSTTTWQALFVANAAIWRVWFSLGIGYILDSQSSNKAWTRHFIKYGETTGRAWRQWKGLYLLSLTMTHASFVAAALKMYALPEDWSHAWAMLRHVLGLALISLQIWTATSVWQSLGEFGWYFGDFFFDAPGRQLTYSGIYRFLNNPDRILGLAGLWGVALITWKTQMFFLALTSHVLALTFIQFVEKPHMQRRYGELLRRQSGLSKSIRRALPKQLRRLPSFVDSVVDESIDFIEDFVDSARPILAKGVGTFVSDTRKLFSQYPARIAITRISPDLAGLNPNDYELQVEGLTSDAQKQIDQSDGREGVDARGERKTDNGYKTLMFEYGAPVKVKWVVPENHSKRDWIGLYMVSDNESREVTRVSSRGRWVPTNKGDWGSPIAEVGVVSSDEPFRTPDGKNRLTGEVVFEGDKLYWTTGVFEFRYHHAGKHSVMAISRPFEVRIARFDEDDLDADSNVEYQQAIEDALLPVVRNCFDRHPDIAPRDAEDDFSEFVWRDGKWAKRVVYGVHQMFGIEFSPEVVKADGTVRKLAWRICNAKKVLAPYSMSPSRGRSTPRPNTPK